MIHVRSTKETKVYSRDNTAYIDMIACERIKKKKKSKDTKKIKTLIQRSTTQMGQ
jgi:hypothetical protein